MSGPRDRDAYEEGREVATSGDDDLDEVAGSANKGDEIEYFAEQWADQDEDLEDEE